MNRHFRTLAWPLLALMATGADARSPKPEVAGTGETRSCLPLARVQHTRVLDDQTILFYTKDRKVYRNLLGHRCPSLGFNEAFTYKIHMSSLCETDLIEVLEGGRGTVGASCALSAFERVEVVKPTPAS